MSFKYVAFYVGCAAAWFILLPLLVAVGGIALLAYAVLSELGDWFMGGSAKTLDSSTAREMARQVCLDH